MATGKPTQDQAKDYTPERQTGAQTKETGASDEKLHGSERTGRQQDQSVPVEKGEQAGVTQARPQGALARYGGGPFAMMQRMTQEMDELFDTFFYGRPTGGRSIWQSQLPSLWAPDVEIAEEANKLRVSLRCFCLKGRR